MACLDAIALRATSSFVVYCTGIVEERANNFVDAVLARIIKELRCITFRSELCLGTIGDDWAGICRERIVACKGKDA